MKKLVQSKTCVAAPGVDDVLSKAASNNVNAAELTARMAQPDGAYPELIGDWLLTARKYLHNCGMDERPAAFAKAADTLAAIVSEDSVEDTVRRVDCGGMSIINDARMWPYEQRFSREIVARRFRDAEVTRRVWSETITTFSTECAKRLNMRDRIAARTQLDNLEHIIGLDDSLLIDLRSRLLMAMEKGDANAVATLSSAISQREGALDQRHTNDQFKQLDIRYRIAEKQRLAAEAELGEAKRVKVAQMGADAIASAKGANQAAQDAIQTAQAAIHTAKDIENTVSLARSVFGF